MIDKSKIEKKIKRAAPTIVYKELIKWKYLFPAIFGNVNIEYLVVCVGQACNFKCRDCGNFAPYSPMEFRRYKVEDIIENLKIILNNTKSINRLQIQGGEPFLYSDLDKLIRYLGQFKKSSGGGIGSITIATNGSIMPSDELLQLLKNNNVDLRISDYNIVRDQAQALQKKCEDMGIRCVFYEFVGNQTMWYFHGGIDISREEKEKVAQARYWHCGFNSCLTLERGKLAHCSRAINASTVQKFESKNGDYLEVCDDKRFKKQLIKYLAFRHPMEACRYCKGTDDSCLVPPAVQIEERR